MKQEIYLFGVFLILMVVISSLGGAIRYEENFYNEVFDLDDETPNTNDDKLPNVPQGNDGSLMNEANVPSVPLSNPQMNVEEESFNDFNQPMNQPMKQQKDLSNDEEDISAFEDGQYASF